MTSKGKGKRFFASVRADQMPTDSERQVFAKLLHIPSADPFLPQFPGIPATTGNAQGKFRDRN